MNHGTAKRGRGGPRGLMRETIKLCPVQAACDGVRLYVGRELCGPCERALHRRAKRSEALRGEHYVTYELTRRKS